MESSAMTRQGDGGRPDAGARTSESGAGFRRKLAYRRAYIRPAGQEKA